MREVFLELMAMTKSGTFTPYTDGALVNLPNGNNLLVKTQKTFKAVRPIGLRFSKYAFVSEVSAGDYLGFGYGEGATQLLAFQKCISEGVERAIYHATKGTSVGTLNSNGWASHLTSERAFSAALDELIERDAVLVHWLCEKPMQVIAPASWPKWLSQWSQSELSLSPIFKHLRVLISNEGYLPTVTIALLSDDGHGVASHATAPTLDQAVAKALAEVCRIAQIAMENSTPPSFANSDNPFSILEHIKFYAFDEKIPRWLFGIHKTWNEAEKLWKQRLKDFKPELLNAKFHQMASGPLTVGYATCDRLQGLFFGQTKEAESKGLINFDRLKSVGVEGVKNLQPHLVA